jgi:hypothetical protein
MFGRNHRSKKQQQQRCNKKDWRGGRIGFGDAMMMKVMLFVSGDDGSGDVEMMNFADEMMNNGDVVLWVVSFDGSAI